MARWTGCWPVGARPWAAIVLAGMLSLVGCNKTPAPEPEASSADSGSPTAQTAAGESTEEKASQGAAGTEEPPPRRDKQHQSFADATRQGDDPPEGCPRPPDKTVTDKSVYKLLKEVSKSWDSVRYVAPDGKRIEYSATIETDHGVIEMALRPDLAPNHVRSFVALARAGYYDNLCFDRIRHEKANDDPSLDLMAIEAGGPLGVEGEPGNNSIGYWLKPEFSSPDSGVSHEPGTVGACLATDQEDTAGCRFYITLSPAGILDGRYTMFGKVTQGLDVARKIFLEPVIEDDSQDEGGNRRPLKPVVIHKVTIHTQVTEAK